MRQPRLVNQAYHGLVEAGEISLDVNQCRVVDKLDELAQILLERPFWSSGRRGLFRRRRWITPVKGLYIWGGVGRGKTFLMDLFVDVLPEDVFVRLHFHRFMNQVHERLASLQGIEDPLEAVADEFAQKVKAFCLDEFFVCDIADAMVLGRLLDALFRRGVSLITTSNIEPKNLYKDGLQRDRFLPAITLIEMHCNILVLDSGADYRLRTLEHAKLYYTPYDSKAVEELWKYAYSLSSGITSGESASVEIKHRKLEVHFTTDDVVWFDFDVLCGWGRAVTDYIEIARVFHTVILTEVPELSAVGDEKTRRFLNLVDEFYDRSVNFLIGADVPIDDLYIGGRLEFEMARCKSRLLEMQSVEYLERPHKPE